VYLYPSTSLTAMDVLVKERFNGEMTIFWAFEDWRCFAFNLGSVLHT